MVTRNVVLGFVSKVDKLERVQRRVSELVHHPQGGHNVLSPLAKIVTLPFIILADNTEGLYKLQVV